MASTKAERLAKVHQVALQRFRAAQSAAYEVRQQCLEDRRFYSIAGAQWEGDLASQFENKPRFEVNKVHNAVIRIFNEYRNNRITVDFIPKDGQDDRMADVCDGLFRSDEQDSNAQEAYDNAFEEGVGGGFGAFRLRTCYEDEDDDENTAQRIRMEPIFDADSSVFFDIDAKRQDKADASHCFVLYSITIDAYKDKYNDDPATWPKDVRQSEFDWCLPNAVILAEYYVIEEKTALHHVFRGLDDEELIVSQQELDDDEDKLDELIAIGFREVRQKKVKERRVHKYLMSGNKVVEDCGVIAGKCIPIIPYFAKRWYVDGIERCQGHVRLAKDAQRLANMLRSWLADIATQSPVAKPIVTPEQINGHTTMWSEDSVRRFPYLMLNQMVDQNGNPLGASPVGYTKPPEIPPSMAALLEITEKDLLDLLGNQQAGEEIQPNISGKVVELIQSRLDMQAYIYVDNFAKAMKRTGEVWLSMAKDILVEDKRRMKTVGRDGAISSAVLRQPAYDDKMQEQFLDNDLGSASMEVWADVGPSSSSQRQALVRSIMNLAQLTADPQDKSMLLAVAASNLEGEGLSDLRAHYRKKLIRAGVVKPNEEEAAELQQELANQQPDPQALLAQSMAKQADAEAGKATAQTLKAVADTKKTEAEVARILSEIDTESQDRVLNVIRLIMESRGSGDVAQQALDTTQQGPEVLPTDDIGIVS